MVQQWTVEIFFKDNYLLFDKRAMTFLKEAYV